MIDTPRQRTGYALGANIAQSLMSQGLTEFDPASLLQGLTHAISGKTLAIPPEEIGAILQSAVQEASEAKFAANKKAGQDFLSANADKDDVTVLDSGLQYKVLESGSGKSPGPTDRVTTHYHGMLVDGTVFDSSVNRGEPATFGVNQVIKGWTEALQLMKEGDKWRLYIPSDLAYGANPRPGGPIEPHSALIFDVQLLSVA